jgi:hypothetical protein
MSATTSTARPSRETAEQNDGILLLIDAQTGPAPLEAVFAHAQIFNEFDAPARAPHCQRKSHILKRHASRLRSEYGPCHINVGMTDKQHKLCLQVGTELKNALGAASSAFVNASLIQLVEAAKVPGGGISEIAVNASLTFIENASPEMRSNALS